MQLLLVAINAKYIHSNPAVLSLYSCAGEYQPYIQIMEFTINQQPSFIIREIYKKQPDVIAFSCYIWNRSILGQIIPDLRKILPDTDIWAGGPEVSFHAAETIREWQLRGVMAGAGERSFYHLAAAYFHGTAYRLPAILDETALPRIPLDDIPFWYGDLADFEHRIIYYESSRGCPFSCSYCLSSIEKTMDFRSVERVCQELDFFLERNVPQVKFIDRTFNCKKSHALPILQHILEHDNGITNFHFEITADLLDEDYFSLLGQIRPGAVQLEIGVQSTCPATIAEINRTMDFQKTAAAVQRICSKKNIHVHLDLIAGLPFEDLRTFQTSFHDVYALRPQQLQLGFLKVLKGSAMELRARDYGLVYSSQPPYEVLSTKWLSYEDICQLKQVEEVLELYYNSGQFTHTLEFLTAYFATPYAMYESLAAWYAAHDLFGVQSSRLRKYEILLEFGTARITAFGQPPKNLPQDAQHTPDDPDVTAKQQICIFRELLTYDFYLREHVKNRPSFAFSQKCWKDAIHDVLKKESETHELFPELSKWGYRELTRLLHTEVFTYLFREPVLVLFCYETRDPLTHNGYIKKTGITAAGAVFLA